MKFKLLFVAMAVMFTTTSYGQFGKLIDKAKKVVSGEEGLSQLDASNGLKEALQLGVDEAVTQLSVDKGYLESPYKILLPEEAQKVSSKLQVVPGFKGWEEDVILKMNQAAEIAAKKATPIFVDAIKQMTFEDAVNIVRGDNDAGTRYLEEKSQSKLYDAFLPIIQATLDEVNIRDLWSKGVNAYNKVQLFGGKVNPDLDDHVNNMALVGMFGLIEQKEEGVRTDLDQQSSDLLKKVFGSEE